MSNDNISFQNSMGVDFYNLEYSIDERVSKTDFDRYLEFCEKYIYPQLRDRGEDFSKESVSLNFGSVYTNYHQQYRNTVDKVIEKQRLDDAELANMQTALHGRLTYKTVSLGDRIGYVLKDEPGSEPICILKPAYQFIYRLSNDGVKIGRCAREGCNNLFLITPGGKPQKYCSASHKVLAYKARKASMAAVG